MTYVDQSPMEWKGAYSGATAYVVDDVVVSGGVQYVCILATTGNAPPNGTYWELSADDAAGQGMPAGGTSGQILEKIDGTDYNTQWVDPPTTPYYQWAESLSETSASAQYVEKITMTTTSLDAGDYKIQVTAQVKADNANTSVDVQIEDDDTTVLANVAPTMEQAGIYQPFSMSVISTLAGHAHQIDLDFTRSGGGSVYMKDVQMEITEL